MWVELPVLPLPLAIACCVINFILPGIGTMIAGCGWFCCAQKQEPEDLEAIVCDEEEDKNCERCCRMCWAGFRQLIGTIGLVGWGFSCYTGGLLIDLSLKYYKSNKVEDIRTDTREGSTPTTVQRGASDSSSRPVIEQPRGVPAISNNQNNSLKVETKIIMVEEGSRNVKKLVTIAYDENVTTESGGHPCMMYVHGEINDEQSD